MGFSYLAYPWIAWAALDAFHPVTLAIPLLLFCVWFLDTDRLALFAICALLVVSTGEMMGVTIAALGVWYALRRRRALAGSVIAVLGVGCDAICALRRGAPVLGRFERVLWGLQGRGERRGGSCGPRRRSGAILAAAGEGADVLYLVLIAAPVAGAFVLAPALPLSRCHKSW